MNYFESIRHGDREIKKDGSYGEELSEIGKENAKEKAFNYYQEIQESPDGSVFFTVTSNIERAVDTKLSLEDGLEELVENDNKIEIISVKDLEAIEKAKNNKSKKYIIKDFYPSSLLGLGKFKENDHNLLLFRELTKLYNSSILALKTWISREEEVEKLKSEIEKEVDGVNVEENKPSDFTYSPEDFIIPYFKFLKRASEIVDKHFPNRQWKCLQIGHDVQLDLSAMFLLEGEISLKSFEKIKNLRNFLESSSMNIVNDKIIFKYRDMEKPIEADFQTLIKTLEEASEKRKNEWDNKNNKI